jgi:hypothetical protein
MNLGNHNETLLTPPARRRRVRRVVATVVVAGSLGVGVSAMGFGTSPGTGIRGSDSTGDVHEVAKPGQYGTSSGGGSG